MASYNRTISLGNLTRDPEIKYNQNGVAIANFGIAMSDKYTDKQSGEVVENVCFADVVAFGRQAEVVGEYLAKGSPVFIEGSLQFDQWETDEGEKRSKLKIKAFRIQLIGGRREEGSGQGDGSGNGSTEEDIPF